MANQYLLRPRQQVPGPLMPLVNSRDSRHSEKGGVMPQTLELRNGKVLVVEDAKTASLVIVARDLESRRDKIEVLEEVLRALSK
jgi:hypothetical protein